MASNDIRNAASDAAERAADAVRKGGEAASDKASRAGENVRDFAAKASSATSDIYEDARTKVRDTVDGLPDASAAIEAGRRAYDRGNRAVGRQVGKQPLEALLLAGAIGYLVGWATNRV